MYNNPAYKGVQILDVPSNSFNQEPKSDSEVVAWAKKTYNVTFPILTKQDVNGANTSELYRWLRTHSSDRFDASTGRSKKIEWNYAKFLVDNQGRVVKYFTPADSLDSVAAAVKELL